MKSAQAHARTHTHTHTHAHMHARARAHTHTHTHTHIHTHIHTRVCAHTHTHTHTNTHTHTHARVSRVIGRAQRAGSTLLDIITTLFMNIYLRRTVGFLILCSVCIQLWYINSMLLLLYTFFLKSPSLLPKYTKSQNLQHVAIIQEDILEV